MNALELHPDKQLPQNLDFEQSALSACLVSTKGLDTVASILRPEDFYSSAHGILFGVLLGMREKELEINHRSVLLELRDRGLSELFQPSYVPELSKWVWTPANAEHYAREVRSKRVLRDMLGAAMDIAELAWSDDEIDDITARAEGLLRKAIDHNQSTMTSFRTLMGEVYDDLVFRNDHPGELQGISTGFRTVDSMTGGLEPGQLVVIGARPGEGKSVIGMNIVVHVARLHGPVVVYSLEMRKDALARRCIASHARVDSRPLRTGQIVNDQWRKIGDAASQLAELPVHIDDSSSIAVANMLSRARRQARDRKLMMVMVDYLQLIKPAPGAEGRTQEVGQIARDLKNMARQLDCVVLALAQLNRDVDKRANRIPTMADLRESGDIEAAADHIWLLHSLTPPDSPQVDGPVDMIVPKHREGVRDNVPLYFHRRYNRFDERSEH